MPYQRQFWIVTLYLTVIAFLLYPAFHEGFGLAITVWNCLPLTLGLALVAIGLNKSQRFSIAAIAFVTMTAVVAIYYTARWLFTSLDTDPHSGTTKLVFVFAPVVGLSLGTMAFAVAWFATRDSFRNQ